MPAVVDSGQPSAGGSQITDRELLLKALTMGQMINEMRNEINDLRQMVSQLARSGSLPVDPHSPYLPPTPPSAEDEEEFLTPEIIEDEVLGLEDRERRAIIRALEQNHGNRKQAAADLHISERSLYRKLKAYNISE